MAKIVLNDLASTYDITLINDNFSKIESEFQNKVLYRNNPEGEPNTLQTDVDANGKRIYNLPKPTTSGEPLRLEDLENVAGNLEDAQAAANTAVAAAVSATASAASAASASSNASSSANAAAASELDAENAASSAAGSANTATVQATASSNSAAAALVSENAAAASAAAALVSENNAADSADDAAASAAAAAGAVTDHINDAIGAHAATAISNTPAGNIAATTVQAAINELDSEKLSTTATTLPASFTASSLTSVGTLTALTVSGQASFAAGSAAAPSVKVGGEQNGLYSDGAGSLSFATAGARVVRMGTVGGTGNYLRLDANNTPMVTAIASATNADIGIASAGTGSVLFATNGSISNLQWRVNHTANSVNIIQATGAATGGAPSLSVGGTDANVFFNYFSKGGGSHQFLTGGGLQFAIGHSVSAANYWLATGAASGGLPTLTLQGSDANIGSYMSTKGTGAWRFATGGGDQFRIQNVASSVNYWSAYGGATTNLPILYVDGADANISAGYSLKGGGSHVFYTGSTSVVQMVVQHVPSTVNWPIINGSATGNAVTISTGGSDTNIYFNHYTKGNGWHQFLTGGGLQFAVGHVASAVNYAKITGSATGNAATISAAGSDSSVALGLYSKNAGIVFAVVQNALALTISNQASSVNSLVITGSATGNAVQIATTGSDANRGITINATGTGRVAIGTGAGGVVAGFGTYDSAEKAVYLMNTTTAPTANPITGGYLYCEGGALKYRGSSGTITTIAAA